MVKLVLVAILTIIVLSSGILMKSIQAQEPEAIWWDWPKEKMAILTPPGWVKASNTNTFYLPTNPQVSIFVITYNPTSNTVFPSINTPIKQVAEGMLRIDKHNKPNFHLMSAEPTPSSDGYNIWYTYDKDGVKKVEGRYFYIDNGLLYEVRPSLPASSIEQHKNEIGYVGTFLHGSEWDQQIGILFKKFEGNVAKIDTCAKQNLIDALKTGPRDVWDDYCQTYRHRF